MASKKTGQAATIKSTHDNLVINGFNPEQPLQVRKTIVESEKGKKYTLEVLDNKASVSYQVDGNIIKEGEKCDKLILVKYNKDEWAEIFIELKGVDVSHAIDQLLTTLKKQIFKHPSNKDIRARIVATSFPSNKANPIMENAKKEFASKPLCCDLRGLKNGQKDKI